MTNECLSIEIAREKHGEDSRSVRLSIEASGAVLVDAQDLGRLVEATFGDGDYEFWVRVKPDALARLAFELLKDKYGGRADAVDDLRRYCEARGVAHDFETWA
ncbi:MAG: hypothetical protein ISS15_09850 [Alphaproteobacteria bacterium]|nr:hypothetical protein [Alphaproteobacteria bacterium]MBL7097951.1 hypothetical protein [Alphaproteobacteria bacterium]